MKVSLFVLYISDTVGRNFVGEVYTVIQKVFIRNVSLRFYAKSKFCVCFEVHIPVGPLGKNLNFLSPLGSLKF